MTAQLQKYKYNTEVDTCYYVSGRIENDLISEELDLFPVVLFDYIYVSSFYSSYLDSFFYLSLSHCCQRMFSSLFVISSNV